jgi:protein-tyrosine phosphatase
MRGGVLVHCWAGVSRSVSCICAYLMESEGYTFHEALNYVRINRPVANPNEGFRQQLELYEQVRYSN